MPKKMDKTARIVAVMKKLHRMEEMQKVELQRQLNALRQSEQDIIGKLAGEDALHGLVLDTSTRFLRTLAREAEKVSQAQQTQSKKLRERAGKVKQAEKLHDTFTRRKTTAENEKHLNEVIELYAGKRGASLP
jgi:hypothetical protein